MHRNNRVIVLIIIALGLFAGCGVLPGSDSSPGGTGDDPLIEELKSSGYELHDSMVHSPTGTYEIGGAERQQWLKDGLYITILKMDGQKSFRIAEAFMRDMTDRTYPQFHCSRSGNPYGVTVSEFVGHFDRAHDAAQSGRQVMKDGFADTLVFYHPGYLMCTVVKYNF